MPYITSDVSMKVRSKILDAFVHTVIRTGAGSHTANIWPFLKSTGIRFSQQPKKAKICE